MSSPQVNIEDLAAKIRAKRGAKSLRQIAKETNVSFSTLSRIEKGRVPDLETFTRLCTWLNVPAETFTGHAASAKSHEDEIYAHLRAERTLPQDVSESLIMMIRAAYSNMGTKKSGKIHGKSTA